MTARQRFLPSRLILGTAAFGTKSPTYVAWEILDTYADRGGRVLDTAAVYGAWNGDVGASERTIGHWLRRNDADEAFVIITKGGHPEYPSGQSRLNPQAIFDDFRRSQDNLGREKIDIYLLHKDEEARPVSELLDLLIPLRQTGSIGTFGLSNWQVPRLREAWNLMKERGEEPFGAIQTGWSLAHTPSVVHPTNPHIRVDADHRQFHADTAVPLLAYSPLAQGFFAPKADEQNPHRVALERYDSPDNFRRQRAVKELAKRIGATPTQVALAWLLRQPERPWAVIGPSTTRQVDDSLGALQVYLNDDELVYLEQGID